MVRITRRDFLKYCSIAAGALGLSASTLMKVENVLAANGATDVVWISGSACTGCTMSLLNSVFYTTIDDLLLNRINLAYLDTAMATAGAYVNGQQWQGSNALAAAQNIYNNSAGFVLVVEGAIPTGKPLGGSDGDFCRIGDLTGEGDDTVMDNVAAFAAKDTCLAVLCVGTCSSYGGIPGARGNVTGAKGVAYSGTTAGGAIVSNTGKLANIKVTAGGSNYNMATFAAGITGGGATTQATATAHTDYQRIKSLAVTNGGSGYTYALVSISAPNVAGGTQATGFAKITGGAISSLHVAMPGTGYTSATVTITGDGTLATGSATIGSGAVTVVSINTKGAGYTSAPTISFTAGGGNGAEAVATITAGDIKNRTGLAAKVVNIPGCPPHPDWIVGAIAHILDTNVTLPALTSYYRPVDYGYGAYQCNAGPCPWRFNNKDVANTDHNARYPVGNSKNLGKHKWALKDAGTEDDVYAQGCIGILGCKGRKTKADCSRRRWNSDAAETYGVNWCVGSRAGCHGCTEPAFPDKVGKFFTFA